MTNMKIGWYVGAVIIYMGSIILASPTPMIFFALWFLIAKSEK